MPAFMQLGQSSVNPPPRGWVGGGWEDRQRGRCKCLLRAGDPQKAAFWTSLKAVMDGPTQEGKGGLPLSRTGGLERLQPSRKTKWVGRSTWEHHLGSGPVLEQRMQTGWSWTDALKMLTGRWGHKQGNKRVQ